MINKIYEFFVKEGWVWGVSLLCFLNLVTTKMIYKYVVHIEGSLVGEISEPHKQICRILKQYFLRK